jgi:RimJ/RimL family protein N-acetyltransferase
MNRDIKIRSSTINDLNRMLEIYEYARKQMRLNGNPSQWTTYPPKSLLEDDIINGVSYVVESDSGIIGTFVFSIGEDPTYQLIEEGKWLNTEAYGTIHRIASDGTHKGLFNLVEEYCSQLIGNIRVDTHEDNKIMLHILEKAGFTKCGIIYTHDGSPRIAFQKSILNMPEVPDESMLPEIL